MIFKQRKSTSTNNEKIPARLFSRLKAGLSNTGAEFRQFFSAKKPIDVNFIEELETCLLLADVGILATRKIIMNLQKQISQKKIHDRETLLQFFRHIMRQILLPCTNELIIEQTDSPFVIFVVGVNGSGKTTTIGKLTQRFKNQELNVMLAAGDTFRAAAVEQLKTWGLHNDVPVISQDRGTDSAAVIFDAVNAAKARSVEVLIIDTAGRLHTQTNLMEELKKVKRVMQKAEISAPHETLLVLDAGCGQNALQQAQQFHQQIGVTGIALTKLDGTAKGGIIFAIAEKLKLPLRFVGVGENAEDLQIFNAEKFVDALLDNFNDN